MRKGGGGKVAVNPDHVTHVRSATGAFTDIFFDGHQVAVEGAFDEVVARLSAPVRTSPEAGALAGPADPRREGAPVFGQVAR
jgi:hypothetical protein